MIHLLLDHPYWKWIISLLAGLLVGFFLPSAISEVHDTFVTILPGALLSLAGFILTAAAIVVSLKDQGLLKEVADRSPEAWNDLMGQFYTASKYSIFYCLFLICFDFLPLSKSREFLPRIAYGSSFALFTLVIIQLLMAIRTLEDASYISSKKVPREPEKSDHNEEKGYSLPDDAPKRMYEEPPEEF